MIFFLKEKMNLWWTTILLIGKRHPFLHIPTLKSRKGFTFMEVMVALMILSLGVVMILKSFMISMDRMTYLNARLYANTILDNQHVITERLLRAYKSLPVDMRKIHHLKIGPKELQFVQTTNIGEVEQFVDVFNCELKLSWEENGKSFSLSRSRYITDFGEQY